MGVDVTGAEPLASRLAGALGGDGHVHVADFGALADGPLAALDEADWAARAEEPIWNALVALQQAYARLRARGGGAVVVILPSFALTGAAGLAPQAAAAEGIRQLVKSAARAWGTDAVRVNCVTLPIEDWGFSPGHGVPNRYGPSLPGANETADVAGAVELLLAPGASGITGTTVGVDRGTVLAP